MNQKLQFLCFQGINNSLPSFWAKLGYFRIKIDHFAESLLKLQMKIGVHLINVELTQLLTLYINHQKHHFFVVNEWRWKSRQEIDNKWDGGRILYKAARWNILLYYSQNNMHIVSVVECDNFLGRNVILMHKYFHTTIFFF